MLINKEFITSNPTAILQIISGTWMAYVFLFACTTIEYLVN